MPEKKLSTNALGTCEAHPHLLPHQRIRTVEPCVNWRQSPIIERLRAELNAPRAKHRMVVLDFDLEPLVELAESVERMVRNGHPCGPTGGDDWFKIMVRRLEPIFQVIPQDHRD